MFDFTKEREAFENKVWLSSPTMHGPELEYIKEAYETNWMSTVGANINEVERLASEKVGCKYAVALSAGTAALHMAVKLAGVKPGDKVFCSDMTFDATVNPVVYEGGVPVFIDTEYDTWNMDPVALEKAFVLYPEVKVVVTAHLYGTPGKVDEIRNVCEQHNAILIEDAAESLGATYKGKQTGQFGDFNAISFNGNKIITGSAGGMLLTDDEEAAKKVRKWSTQSRENAPWYQHEELGYNYRMTNLQAALGVAQMEELPEFIHRKQKNYRLYQQLLQEFSGGTLLSFREGTSSNQWFYSLKLDMEKLQGKNMRDVITTLQERGVQTRAIWGLIHEQLPYQNAIAYEMEKAPYYSSCILNIPSSTQITDDDIGFVVEQIKVVFKSGI